MDNTNELKAILEQYKQNGGDINALVQSLTTTGKTPLGLNQWVKSDKPCMDDFNEDNRIVDEKIRELQANKANKEKPQKYNLPLASGVEIRSESYYSKNQFEEIYVSISVKPSAGSTIQNNATIATLPVGFRPSSIVYCTVVSYSSGSYYPAICAIRPDGVIQYYGQSIEDGGYIAVSVSVLSA